jgi:hypothetical protein
VAVNREGIKMVMTTFEDRVRLVLRAFDDVERWERSNAAGGSGD